MGYLTLKHFSIESLNYLEKHTKYIKIGYTNVKTLLIEENILTNDELNQLEKNIELHDKDKLNIPYYNEIFLYKIGILKDIDPKKQTKATLKHIMNQPHHPEYWDKDYDPNLKFDMYNRDGHGILPVDFTWMPYLYLVEMCLDFYSVSIEKGNTIVSWLNFAIPKKFDCKDTDKISFLYWLGSILDTFRG